jgi:hypothetical protein
MDGDDDSARGYPPLPVFFLSPFGLCQQVRSLCHWPVDTTVLHSQYRRSEGKQKGGIIVGAVYLVPARKYMDQ